MEFKMSTILEEKLLLKDKIIDELFKFVKSDKKEKEQKNFITFLEKNVDFENFDLNFCIPKLSNLSILEIASYYNSYLLIGFLLKNGANPNYSETNSSPLNIACGRNNEGAIIKLLEYNANIFFEDCTGKTPFSRICETANMSIMDLFLKKFKIEDYKKVNKNNETIFDILRNCAKIHGVENINKVIARLKESCYLKEMNIKTVNVNRFKI
jgi:ankyrin repeat protein